MRTRRWSALFSDSKRLMILRDGLKSLLKQQRLNRLFLSMCFYPQRRISYPEYIMKEITGSGSPSDVCAQMNFQTSEQWAEFLLWPVQLRRTPVCDEQISLNQKHWQAFSTSSLFCMMQLLCYLKEHSELLMRNLVQKGQHPKNYNWEKENKTFFTFSHWLCRFYVIKSEDEQSYYHLLICFKGKCNIFSVSLSSTKSWGPVSTMREEQVDHDHTNCTLWHFSRIWFDNLVY